ncbi:hypothetical protein C2R22_24575 (plasmid) [Salinigranum rubrum]|uniref:Uncharacterized protein n=1 Tax=Salinigranum rubrum TaxID=755307 RepID=A0A2I8VS26_9EURY|nr:hypothetical protein [Salinigranum rubrum]AUV84707.1 hypothetical protein C2R22_24575 [Salinigranum rubrum]
MNIDTSRTRTRIGILLAVFTLISAATFGLVAAGSAVAQTATQDATLAVSQPDYVEGSVEQSSTNGTTMYTIGSRTATLKPQNFDSADVVGFGIEEDAGKLTYDDRFDVYRFDASNNTGTFTVYFETEREVTREVNNSTTTQTVRDRYTAIVRVTDASEYAHLKGGTLEERRQAAENWSAFASGVRGVYGEDADLETRTQQAINLLKLQKDPLAALSGGFTSTWLILLGFGGPGALLVTISIVAWHIWSRRDDLRYRNRQESLKADAADLDDRYRELQHEERKRVLQNKDWQDIVPDDHVARAMRDTLGETVFDGMVRLQELLLPEKLVRDRLQAMDQHGYVGVVERTASDGGPDGSTSIESARVAHRDDLVDDVDTVSLDEPSDEFVDALDWSDDDLVSFDLVGAELTRDPDVRLDGLDLDELMVELDTQRQNLDDPDVWGEYILQFVRDVRESDYCDQRGQPDETRYILNQWLQIAQKSTEKFDFPLLEMMGDSIERALIEHDPVAEAETTVRDVQEGRGS